MTNHTRPRRLRTGGAGDPYAQQRAALAVHSPVDELVAVERQEAEAYLKRIEQALSAAGVEVERVCRAGRIAPTILAVAQEYGAKLLVLATHGRSGPGCHAYGSAVSDVLLRAGCRCSSCAWPTRQTCGKPEDEAPLSARDPARSVGCRSRQEGCAMAVRTSNTHTAKVLVVKDGTAAMRVVELMLQDLGYDVLAEADARDALAILDYYGGPIDLLVTNVVMPEMLGVELARRVQKRQPHANVLFVSAYPVECLARYGVDPSECVLYIQQPFHAATLAAKVREVLTSGSRREADAA
jgi:CheY-like chemotaxis protein